MSNAMVVYERMAELQTAANAMHASGYFGDVKSQAQAMVKVMAGAEIGLPPFASMSGIHIVNGKPTLGANLIATLVKNDPRYDYRVKRADNEACVLAWYEGGAAVGESSFSIQEANAAGLTGKQTWKAYASDMLFARALTRGARRYAPGIFGGAPIYTPDEMGVDTDEDGHIVQGEVVNVTPPATQPTRATGNGQQPQAQAATVDAGPPSDAEVAISASNGNFVNMAAALLGTDELTIKKRMGALRMNAPKTPAERVVAYRRLRDDMGNADDIMQPAAQQPALVTVEQPATDYQE
jgi:hypothetical protein